MSSMSQKNMATGITTRSRTSSRSRSKTASRTPSSRTSKLAKSHSKMISPVVMPRRELKPTKYDPGYKKYLREVIAGTGAGFGLVLGFSGQYAKDFYLPQGKLEGESMDTDTDTRSAKTTWVSPIWPSPSGRNKRKRYGVANYTRSEKLRRAAATSLTTGALAGAVGAGIGHLAGSNAEAAEKSIVEKYREWKMREKDKSQKKSVDTDAALLE